MVRKRQNGGAEMAKLWCIFGVYMLDFLYFLLPRWRNGGAIAAVGGVVAGFLLFGFFMI